jgi:hypothetical protein
VLLMTGGHDTYLGHPDDARAFLEELGAANARLEVLGRASGARRDYGHVDLLTHPDAVEDHFPRVLAFLREHLAR